MKIISMATQHTIIDISQITSSEDVIWHRVQAPDYHCYIPMTEGVPEKVALPGCPHIPLPLSVVRERTHPAYTVSNPTPSSSPPIPADPLNPPTTVGLDRQRAQTRIASSLREFANGDVLLDLRGCVKGSSMQTIFNALEDGRTPYFIDMKALVTAIDDFLFEAEKTSDASPYAKSIGTKLQRVKVLDLSNCLIFDEDILLLWQLVDMLRECRILILRRTQLRYATLAQVQELLKMVDFIDVCFTQIGETTPTYNYIQDGLTEGERVKWVGLRGRWVDDVKRGDFQYISPEVYTDDGKHLRSVESILRVYREYVGQE